MSTIHISVRALVEYVYRSGSIDTTFQSAASAIEGTKIHKNVQKSYEEGDQKEVYLQTQLQEDDITFMIDGRCDGLLFRNEKVMIDEIKSFSRPFEQLDENGSPVHWAQAKVYAYMYAKANTLQEVNVQLTYVHMETNEIRQFRQNFRYSELESFVSFLIKEYMPLASFKSKHNKDKLTSIKELSFPFELYRAGQRKLAGAVYKSILEGKDLYVKAPTGIGKTISTLFPTIKSMGEEKLDHLFYLTAKTITRTAAEDAFKRMFSCGLAINTVTITAKDKICFKEETKCQKDYCEYANGYYDRINGAVLDILTHERIMTRDIIESYARKHRVCPFEFSIDLAYSVDAVISDYNYIFDPRVSLKRIPESQKKRTALLVDEAHNLVDRGREMFSASLNKEIFLQLKREFKKGGIYDAVSSINTWFIQLRKEHSSKNEFTIETLGETIPVLLQEFSEKAEKSLLTEFSQTLLEAYFMVQQFSKISELLNEEYVIYGEKHKQDLKIKLFCIDPSMLLKKMGKGYGSKIFFSATLSPIPYYKEVLGGQESDYILNVPSPFSNEQIDTFITPLSTRYNDREHTKSSIAKIIQSLVKKRPGNYLVFFSSYQYLMTVYEEYKSIDSETKTLLQDSGMNERQREEFLDAFKPQRVEPLVGFAVLGGVFSEGVDLIGNRLTGVVVVGVGLPQLCFERNLMKNHFNQRGKNGYHYAYVYPGMNKVLQAGGRLIRSEHDKGTMVLIDDRFLKPPFQPLLPSEWKPFTIVK